MKRQRARRGGESTLTLRRQILIAFFALTTIPILLIGGISLYSLRLIVEQSLEDGLRTEVRELGEELSNHLAFLDFTARQLTFDIRLAHDYNEFLRSADVYDRFLHQRRVQDLILFSMNTNTHSHLAMFFSETDRTPVIGNHRNVSEIPVHQVLMTADGATFFGPHESYDPISRTPVFSVIREVFSTAAEEAYLYIESDPIFLRTLLETEWRDEAVELAMVNEERIIYSSVPDHVGRKISDTAGAGLGRRWETASWDSGRGWGLHALIPKSYFVGPMRQWLASFLLVALLSLGAGLIVALGAWRRVYAKIGTLADELIEIDDSEYTRPIKYSGVQEIDEILSHLENSRQNVLRLIRRVETEQSEKSLIELEKLRNQINPHFLHNTLNNIQWLAISNGQAEIKEITRLLISLLNYNLGREGSLVLMEQELAIIHDYLELQKFRYDFSYEIRDELDSRDRTEEIPRFVLQPVVENALYHGLSGHGEDTVVIQCFSTPEAIVAQVTDHGPGIEQSGAAEGPRRASSDASTPPEETAKHGMGVGLAFVERTMSAYYGDGHVMIEQIPEGGTRVTLEFTRAGAEDVLSTGG